MSQSNMVVQGDSARRGSDVLDLAGNGAGDPARLEADSPLDESAFQYLLGTEPKEIRMCNTYRVISFCFVAGLLFCLAGEVRAQIIPITSLYSTGFGPSGVASTGTDGNWSIIGTDATPFPQVLTEANDFGALGPNPNPSPPVSVYFPDTATSPNSPATFVSFLSTTAAPNGSNWIGPADSASSSATTLDYQTTFMLPALFSTGPSPTVTITGGVTVDNALMEIKLNGQNVGTFATGTSLTYLTGAATGLGSIPGGNVGEDNYYYQAYEGSNPLVLNGNSMNAISFSSDNTREGPNTLDFIALNYPDTATAIDINISGTYTVPEPASASLLIVGAVGLLSRRLRRQQPCAPSVRF